MKLAFSTLGCPDFDWPDLLAMAKDFGFQGIEMRGLGRTIFSLRGKPFLPENVAATAEQLRSLHLEIPCISSGCALKYADRVEATINELHQYIDLAKALDCKYIRVLGDEKAEIEGEVDDELVISTLLKVLPYAEENQVSLLVETCGVYADTKRLRALLNRIPSDYVGAVWDMHHPFRFFNETPEESVQNLGAYIKYTQIKDSLMIDGKVSYQITGEGDVPIAELVGALRSINYEGYITFEWLRSYAPYLSDAGIVFPQFAHYMSTIFGEQPEEGGLYENRAKTGVYIWPKNKLIDLTFPQLLDRVVNEFPNQLAFSFTEMDYRRTYSEFRDDVDTFARSLIAMGVKPGDHVAIWATNVPQWFITFWAATRIGAVLVTVNTAYKSHELEYLLRQSDTHTLVMTDGYKDTSYTDIVMKLCPELEEHRKGTPLHIRRLPFLRNIVTVGTTLPGCRTWEEAIEIAETVPEVEVYRRSASVRKDDVCNMQYTSGTTGFPKGVMLTHYNVVNNGKSIGDNLDLSTADEMMIQVPMFHCFGMVLSMTACMTHGSAMSPITAFSPRKALECIRREKITAFNGVPTMFIAMFNHPDYRKTDFSHMRTGIMAGAGCPPELMRRAAQPDEINMRGIVSVYG
ncbi:MAG: AMP-binding protein, partial [Oscillospiraceae bacterium]|nr:AMP-binding protein [Oscillospiraceae bacterium]